MLIALRIATFVATIAALVAPNVQHRIAVPFYELSLLLDGALLAVAFTR